MKRALFLLLTMLIGLHGLAQSVVNRLDITVMLDGRGNAHIHEVWNIDVGRDVKSEWYVAHYNMGGREIVGLAMTEDGTVMTTVAGEWDVDADKKEKAGKCGVRGKEGGYEICWGVASRQNHTYTADYDIKGLVQDYPDNDGFGYWFVDLNKKDPIRHFHLSVLAPGQLTSDNCKIWGFGFEGKAGIADGKAVVAADGDIHKVGVLLSLEKGLVTPALKGDGTFAELKAKAFEGSDFGGGSKGEPVPPVVWMVLGALVAAGAAAAGGFGIHLKLKRRKARQLPYCRDVSPSWTLLKAAKVLKPYHWYDGDDLVSAVILRLISRRQIEVVDDDEMDKHGKRKKAFRIVSASVEKPKGDKHSDDYICGCLLYVMSRAAGKGRILNPDKLEEWADAHGTTMERLDGVVHPDDDDEIPVSDDDRQRILGLRNYLLDFGRAGERRVGNVRVWDERLVYAQLFGIAGKLGKDIQAICPEYYELSEFGNNVQKMYVHYPYFLSSWSGRVSSSAAASAASSGGTSLRGGGGFSGGGGGGGR